MALLNGELVYGVCRPHEIVSMLPSAKVLGKKPAPRCTKPCLHSAGWYNTGRTSRHTVLLGSKVPERRETWKRNLLVGSPLLLSCPLELFGNTKQFFFLLIPKEKHQVHLTFPLQVRPQSQCLFCLGEMKTLL